VLALENVEIVSICECCLLDPTADFILHRGVAVDYAPKVFEPVDNLEDIFTGLDLVLPSLVRFLV
jgi:hypothetical protein